MACTGLMEACSRNLFNGHQFSSSTPQMQARAACKMSHYVDPGYYNEAISSLGAWRREWRRWQEREGGPPAVLLAQ